MKCKDLNTVYIIYIPEFDFENSSFLIHLVHWIADAIFDKCEKISWDFLTNFTFVKNCIWYSIIYWTKWLKNQVFSKYFTYIAEFNAAVSFNSRGNRSLQNRFASILTHRRPDSLRFFASIFVTNFVITQHLSFTSPSPNLKDDTNLLSFQSFKNSRTVYLWDLVTSHCSDVLDVEKSSN